MENYYSEHEGKTIDKVIREAGLHMQDNVKHVTQAERENWNSKASNQALSAIFTELRNAIIGVQANIDSARQDLESQLSVKLDDDALIDMEPLRKLNLWETNTVIAHTVGLKMAAKRYNAVNDQTIYEIPIVFPISGTEQFMVLPVNGTYLYSDNFEFWIDNTSEMDESEAGAFRSWMPFKGGATDKLHIGLYCEEKEAEVIILLKR